MALKWNSAIKVVLVLDVISCALSIVIGTIIGVKGTSQLATFKNKTLLESKPKCDIAEVKDPRYLNYPYGVVYIIIFILTLLQIWGILNLLIVRGLGFQSGTEIFERCCNWFFVAVIVFLSLTGFLAYITISNRVPLGCLIINWVCIGLIIGILLRFGCIWVVFKFMEEQVLISWSY